MTLGALQLAPEEQGALPSKLLYSLDDLPEKATAAERLHAGKAVSACVSHAWCTLRAGCVAQDYDHL